MLSVDDCSVDRADTMSPLRNPKDVSRTRGDNKQSKEFFLPVLF
jgi:hypothetical protein